MHFFTLIAFVPIFGQFAHAAAVPVAQISAMDIVTITTYKDAGRSGASQTWSLATQSQCSTTSRPPPHSSSHSP